MAPPHGWRTGPSSALPWLFPRVLGRAALSSHIYCSSALFSEVLEQVLELERIDNLHAEGLRAARGSDLVAVTFPQPRAHRYPDRGSLMWQHQPWTRPPGPGGRRAKDVDPLSWRELLVNVSWCPGRPLQFLAGFLLKHKLPCPLPNPAALRIGPLSVLQLRGVCRRHLSAWSVGHLVRQQLLRYPWISPEHQLRR